LTKEGEGGGEEKNKTHPGKKGPKIMKGGRSEEWGREDRASEREDNCTIRKPIDKGVLPSKKRWEKKPNALVVKN